MSLNLKTDGNSTKYKSNADIEEVLSGNFSLGKNSDEVNLKINKVNTTTPVDNTAQKIKDKIELSSNKDIDIGLDLLVNKEKKATKSNSDKNPLKNAYELSSENNSSSKVNNNSELTSSGDLLSGGTGVNQETTSRIEAMINDLNLDKTSRLSQEDIDRLIDNQDNKSRKAGPKLATAADVENEIESSSDHLVSKREKKRESGSLPSDIELESGTQQTSDQVTSDYSTGLNGNPYSNRNPGFPHTNMAQQTFNMAPQMPQMSMEESRKKKQETLFKLEKMRRLGVQGIKHFNMSSPLPEMEEELNRVVHEREVESSVKFQRKCLMAFVTGVELLNNKMDFLDFKLDGWSEQVNDGINEYNEVFEELHEKYKEKAKMAPEVKLLFMLGGSAFMYHLSNSMFKNSIPGMEDIMKQNPELMKQFANAAINQMNNDEDRNAASFMFNNAQAARAQSARAPPPQQYRQAPPQMNNFPRTSPGMPGVVPNNRMPQQSSRPAPQYTAGPDPNMTSTSLGSDSVSEMKSQPSQNERVKTPFNSGTRIQPPVGVDEILNELKSNTDSQVNDDISEVLSQGNRSISLSKRRGGSRKPRRKFNLTVGQ